MAFPNDKITVYTLVDNTDDVLATHPNVLSSELRAVQDKLGIDSSAVNTTIDYFLKHASGAYRTHVHDESSDDGDNIPFSSLTVASEAQGDIVYYNGSNWVRLPAGTTGYRLKSQGAGANPIWVITTRLLGWFISGEIAVGAEQSARIYIPFVGTITKARAYVKTAPTGANLIVDINKNGSTIWTTQANRLTIVAGSNLDTQTNFNVTSVAINDYLTIDIDQVGSTEEGEDLTITLEITES